MKIVGILERIDWPFQIGYNRDEGLRRWGGAPSLREGGRDAKGCKELNRQDMRSGHHRHFIRMWVMLLRLMKKLVKKSSVCDGCCVCEEKSGGGVVHIPH
jgi:hypothetical protein